MIVASPSYNRRMASLVLACLMFVTILARRRRARAGTRSEGARGGPPRGDAREGLFHRRGAVRRQDEGRVAAGTPGRDLGGASRTRLARSRAAAPTCASGTSPTRPWCILRPGSNTYLVEADVGSAPPHRFPAGGSPWSGRRCSSRARRRRSARTRQPGREALPTSPRAVPAAERLSSCRRTAPRRPQSPSRQSPRGRPPRAASDCPASRAFAPAEL